MRRLFVILSESIKLTLLYFPSIRATNGFASFVSMRLRLGEAGFSLYLGLSVEDFPIIC
ncbi:hypothetical protein DesyoDRAFT_2196 [Desulfosporosinus youngiae DSM 17734]|uniref:Uncharacterized protein n=1 Tax=Desulfosporosinus youngiae DSM 17734 TaxID=768710 RepID=H5Y3N7_9FIRM|nr:hypothetical protein DesyoDRAFT_2196 [Desulfosporosinus youngiae DSM 17734]